MAAQGKKLTSGLVLMAAFTVVFIIIFLPLFGKDSHGQAQNGLNYLDNLYNTISKGSAYYIPKVQEDAKKFDGSQVELGLSFKDAKQAELAAKLFSVGGAQVQASAEKLKISGGLGKIFANILADSDEMYHNRGEKVAQKYGAPERLVLYTWHQALSAMQKELDRQHKFAESKMADTVKTRAVECSYNFYGVQPQSIGDKWGIVIFSLAFYVVYTLWYGFGIMYIFEGIGMRLEH
ncbi:MAG: hypothetical protein ACOZHQ_10530 [Thermodesulfobacteriota bacterium]